MICRLPGVIERNSTCDEPVIGYDLPATFVDFADGEIPDTDGTTLRSVLCGEPFNSDRSLLWHFPYYHPETKSMEAGDAIGVDDFALRQTGPQFAIRFGNWKALHFAETDRLVLCDLSRDPGEQIDLAVGRSGQAFVMRRMLSDELNRMNARRPK